MGAGRRIDAGDGDLVTGGAMPCGDAMAPPELPRDAPVVDVFHPFQIDLLILIGNDANRFVALRVWLDCRDCLFRQRLNFDEPLRRKPWLDSSLAAVAVAHVVRVVL